MVRVGGNDYMKLLKSHNSSSSTTFYYKILVGIVLLFGLLWILFGGGEQENGASRRKFEVIGEAPKVQVEVYYEVLCPDSRHFIKRQLYPTWEKIQNIFDVHLKPYGKASHRKNPEGAYTFDCQHGPVECTGNMIHACSIKYIQNQAILLEYVNCMMEDNYEPKQRAEKCGDELGIDWNPVLKCADTIEGQELLAMYGDDTHSLRPKITYIPTIVINGHQERIPQNLTTLICNKYKGKKPPNCVVTL